MPIRYSVGACLEEVPRGNAIKLYGTDVTTTIAWHNKRNLYYFSLFYRFHSHLEMISFVLVDV